MKKQGITLKLFQPHEMELALPILSTITPSLIDKERIETLREMIKDVLSLITIKS